MNLKVYTDGSIVGGSWQSKKAAPTFPHIYGGWLIKTHLDQTIYWDCWDMGENERYSANIAEYGAIRAALSWITKEFPLASLECWSDSQLVVFQLIGKYNCFDPVLLKWRDEVRRLAEKFPSCLFNWHPRETPDAKLADFCSKMLQPKYGGKIPKDWGEFVTQMGTKEKKWNAK